MPETRTRKEIGKALKARGIRQREIARLAGVSQGYVSRVLAHQYRTGRAENVWRVLDHVLNDHPHTAVELAVAHAVTAAELSLAVTRAVEESA